MRKLSQLQYEVIFLYSRGLTFKEIDTALATASRGVYSQVVAKDKGRITRAKTSRAINLNSYKTELKKKLKEVRIHNKYFRDSTQWVKEYNIVPLKVAQKIFRQNYINDSLNKAYKSYCKYKLTFIKNHLEKVA